MAHRLIRKFCDNFPMFNNSIIASINSSFGLVDGNFSLFSSEAAVESKKQKVKMDLPCLRLVV